MRTSNKLIITAFIITIVAMIIRDEQLKAVYLTKSYLNPLKDFTTLDIKDFTAIDNNSAGIANVKIVKGPYKVMVLNDAKDFVHITRENGRLEINAIFKKDDGAHSSYFNDRWVYVSCPGITDLKLDSRYVVGNKMSIDTTTKRQWGHSTLQGFNLDSLYLSMDNGCILQLDSNNIRTLKADVAMNTASNSSLEIKKTNNIAKAFFNIQNNGNLNLYSAIPDLSYTLSDSATLSLTGNVANRAKK